MFIEGYEGIERSCWVDCRFFILYYYDCRKKEIFGNVECDRNIFIFGYIGGLCFGIY